MDGLRRFFLSMFALVFSIFLTIINMIFGWGLHPKSWGIIIGIGIFGQLFALAIQSIATHKE